MRVLIVTNLHPDEAAPQRGRWVMDQVEAIRARGVEVDVLSFAVGRRHYLPAIARIARALRRGRYDLVHAHYGLAGWCARLAGARPLVVTFHGTDVRHPVVGPLSRRLARGIRLTAGVSRQLFEPALGRPGLPLLPGAAAVLPCGPALERFAPRPRQEARALLGLESDGRYLFFPANPRRPEKRHDRAAELAEACRATLLTGGGIDPDLMPLWINAADAVVVTSDYEGFGMAALEALACDVPVLTTPVGVAPFALGSAPGCLVDQFEVAAWAEFARPILDGEAARPHGAGRAVEFAAGAMADRVICAYEDILGEN